LRERAPSVVAFYQSPQLHHFISDITGVQVEPTPLHDQSSCSILFYEQPGDHIGWHYDHNFYKGRHFTVLLSIVNRGAGGLSAARLMARPGGTERTIATPPNTLVVFEGAKVRHKVTPLNDGERRVVLSMTFCSDSRHSVIQEGLRRVKDVAFFGPRALWS
jgi:2OG-Fe(II) oxygenase superfamily